MDIDFPKPKISLRQAASEILERYIRIRDLQKACIICRHWTSRRDLRKDKRYIVELEHGKCNLQKEWHTCNRFCKIPELRGKNMTINEKLYDISYRGQKLGLTVKEFKLLKLLIERAGETLTRDEIFKTVWGEDFMGETRALDMHIAQIRDKIKAAGGDNVIVTVRGVGYRVD